MNSIEGDGRREGRIDGNAAARQFDTQRFGAKAVQESSNVSCNKSETASSDNTWLCVAKLSKHFGAIIALEAIDASICLGEVLALVGDNGAGKSTLVKLLSGAHSPPPLSPWLKLARCRTLVQLTNLPNLWKQRYS